MIIELEPKDVIVESKINQNKKKKEKSLLKVKQKKEK